MYLFEIMNEAPEIKKSFRFVSNGLSNKRRTSWDTWRGQKQKHSFAGRQIDRSKWRCCPQGMTWLSCSCQLHYSSQKCICTCTCYHYRLDRRRLCPDWSISYWRSTSIYVDIGNNQIRWHWSSQHWRSRGCRSPCTKLKEHLFFSTFETFKL